MSIHYNFVLLFLHDIDVSDGKDGGGGGPFSDASILSVFLDFGIVSYFLHVISVHREQGEDSSMNKEETINLEALYRSRLGSYGGILAIT